MKIFSNGTNILGFKAATIKIYVLIFIIIFCYYSVVDSDEIPYAGAPWGDGGGDGDESMEIPLTASTPASKNVPAPAPVTVNSSN